MVSMKAVADRVKVSTATVSRVLNGHPSCSEETRVRVMQAIQELGYRPNSLAKSMRLQRSGTFITVLSDIRNPVFAGMIKGMEDVAYENGYSMLIGNSSSSLQREEHYVSDFLSRKADGILLITPRVDIRRVSELAKLLPVVLINEPRAPAEVPVVGIDDYAAVRKLTEHIISLGYRKIAYIAGDKKAGIAARRLDGFLDAITERRLREDALIIPGGAEMRHGQEGMKRLLELGQLPECVICYNDESAIGAMRQAQSAGLRVPDDIAFCGFDDIPTAELPWPSLTTVHQPTYDVGAKAAAILMDLLEGKEPPERRVSLPFELRVRGSVRSAHS